AHVQGDQLAERRRRTRTPSCGIPESSDRASPGTTPHPHRRSAVARRGWHHLCHLAQVHDIREHETEIRIVRKTPPTSTAERARERDHRAIHRRRRVWPL